MSARGGTLRLKASGIVGGQSEAKFSERVAIHLTEIIEDRTIAVIGVLELQDRLIGFSSGGAYLDRPTQSACVQVCLIKGTSISRDCGFSRAVCRVLAAGIDENVKITVVEYSGLACRVVEPEIRYEDLADEWDSWSCSDSGRIDDPG